MTSLANPIPQSQIISRSQAPRGRRHAGERSDPLEDLERFEAAFRDLSLLPQRNVAEIICTETGEIITLRKNISTNTYVIDDYNPTEYGTQKRKEGFRLQNRAKKFLFGAMNPKKRFFAVHKCFRKIHTAGAGVAVKATAQRAYYSNLFVCSSPWTCPLCAEKISRRREQEILTAIDRHIENGGSCYMLTLTFPHKKYDQLMAMFKTFTLCLRKMRGHRAYRQCLGACSFLGSIRAQEVTWGSANGWHPHTHDLLFLDRLHLSPAEVNALEGSIFELWRGICKSAGLGTPSKRHGVKISKTLNGAQYLAKFGTDRKWNPGKELTSAVQKIGYSDRYTPFDFLRDEQNEERNKRLFVEFAQAFHGSKQLFWSRGLKRRFQINEMSDQEIAEEKRDEAEIIYLIDDYKWYKLLKNKDIRAEILESAEKGGASEVDRVISTYLLKINAY